MRTRFEAISVLGLGYIGLPTAAAFASRGVRVTGVDINQRTVETINRGRIHIVEPELDMVVHAAVTEGFLRAATTPEPADAFIIAVPTPFTEDRKPDLSYIEAASRSIAPVLKKGDLVILESTSPVGATEQMAEWLAADRPDLTFPQQAGEGSDIRIAHCPERVLPGHVMRELVENDRVIGGMTAGCAEDAAALYRIFVEGECVLTNARTAELCKLTENASRDVNIAFANELSLICEKLGVNVWELIRLANRHPRVNILKPGPGVGGHCIAVDPWFIVSSTPEEARLIHTARQVNDGKPSWILSRVGRAVTKIRSADGNAGDEEIDIAVLGLAFKPDIDDLRESPAMRIAQSLAGLENVRLHIVEPNIETLPASLAGHRLVDLKEGIAVADIVLVLVAHREFKNLWSILLPHQSVVDSVGIIRSASRTRPGVPEIPADRRDLPGQTSPQPAAKRRLPRTGHASVMHNSALEVVAGG
jgi:UDP-N-acetyl-D-mannosaminuronic acid dehydrogenase